MPSCIEPVAAVDNLQRRILLITAGLPFLIATLVVGGTFIGFYISDLTGEPQSILYPFIFSTVGLTASIVVSYYIAKRVSRPEIDREG